MSRSQNGFTLIELMIVVCIMAILMTVAIPVLNSQRAKAGDNGATEILSSVTNSAVKLALRKDGSFKGITTNSLSSVNDDFKARTGRMPDIQKADSYDIGIDEVWLYAVDATGRVNTQEQEATEHGFAICNGSTASNTVYCTRIVHRPGKTDDITHASGDDLTSAIAPANWKHRR